MNFDTAFYRLMEHEGNYVNNLLDPGGETKYGISKRSYPNVDIKNLTKEDAKAIFRRDFWNRVFADELHDGVAYQMADFAYHSGIETAIRYLQRVVRVADDGHWGKMSRAAAQAMSETDQIMRLNGLRLIFMTGLSNWPNASRGWARRIGGNLLYGADDS